MGQSVIDDRIDECHKCLWVCVHVKGEHSEQLNIFQQHRKYDTSLVANLLLNPTVNEFLKSTNISQSYKRISSDSVFMVHGTELNQTRSKKAQSNRLTARTTVTIVKVHNNVAQRQFR